MIRAECYLVDVGLGSANVIQLADGSVILIDVGSNFSYIQRVLTQISAIYIRAIIITHSDRDHAGALPRLLTSYRGRIGQVFFSQDRTAKDFLVIEATRQLEIELADHKLAEPIDVKPNAALRKVFPFEGDSDVHLELLYPSWHEHIEAHASGSVNRASAVLLLRCGESRVLFGGDAEIEAWEAIHERVGSAIRADVVAVPHHAGRLGGRHDSCIGKVYADWIHAKTAVVSVATGTNPDHPAVEHIAALKASGACILCTELTSKCCSDPQSFKGGVIDRPPYARERAVPCAGTVIASIGDAGVVIERQDEHQGAIDQKLKSEHPLCR